MKHSKNHPGFVIVARRIAKRQGVSSIDAKRELAASARHSSAKAKRKNPRLKRVKG